MQACHLDGRRKMRNTHVVSLSRGELTVISPVSSSIAKPSPVLPDMMEYFNSPAAPVRHKEKCTCLNTCRQHLRAEFDSSKQQIVRKANVI